MCDIYTLCYNSTMPSLPLSQAELIRAARGQRSQAEFARLMGVDRSCLSRYEREALGAPPSVITYCLREVGHQLAGSVLVSGALLEALSHAREVIAALERAQVGAAAGLPKRASSP